MRREWRYAQPRVAPTTPLTREVVVSPAESEVKSPTVATIVANGVCSEYDAREERMFAEACSSVMESLDKLLSQIAHRMVFVENQIMPPGSTSGDTTTRAWQIAAPALQRLILCRLT